MRKFFALVFVVLLAVTASDAFARSSDQIEHATRAPMAGEWDNDIPARAPDGFARQDTINFGNYEIIGGEYYAVQGGIWDFEDGAAGPGQGGPSLQGWYSIDLTANPGAYWRHITDAIWTADPFNPAYVPLITGTGCAWVGLFASEARALCWATEGPGYGNTWCQRLTSPTFTYTGSGSVNLSLNYWNDTEPDYDYSLVVLEVDGNPRITLNDPGFSDKIGFDAGGDFPGGANAAPYSINIPQTDLGANFRIIFEFTSDGGWSDQDGQYISDYGPFAVDDVVLTGSVSGSPSFNFDGGLQGWTTEACPGEGSFFNIAPLSNYIIQDPCVCSLEGWLVHFHNPENVHEYGQLERAWSPIVDRTQIPNYLSYNRIFADWDMYAEMPLENGVLYRPGWSYYPYECDATGDVSWSPRIGQSPWFYVGEDPACYLTRNVGTAWGLPSDAEQIRFGMEVYASCDAFGIPNCSFVTNATPLMDNFRVRMTGVVDAPTLLFATGGQLQDVFGATSNVLSPTDAANVRIAYNKRMGSYPDLPAKLGDSLVVNGPAVVGGVGQWESRLWFRLARTGPGQASNTLYNTWRNHPQVNKGFAIENGEFSYGLMDSVYNFQGFPQRNQFASYFNETDPGFNWGGGSGDNLDIQNTNAILPNLAFTPGTKIEYFITGTYMSTPTDLYSYLPDTTGSFFLEFEVLPSMRMDGDVVKFPCVLYIDAFNRGAEPYIAPALNVVLNGADWNDPIPEPAPWDKYDYFDPSSNWKAPMFRQFGGTDGALLTQLLPYRAMILNTGTLGPGCMWPEDWEGFSGWLTASECGSNEMLKGFVANGSAIVSIMDRDGPAFSGLAGVNLICDAYSSEGCPPMQATDENYCVQLEPTPGAAWAPDPMAPVDLFGNWCPPMIGYDVIGVGVGGVGNKAYENVLTGLQANYAQVIKDEMGGISNYRTVVDAFSYHVMTMRDLDVWPDPVDQCPVEDEARVEAAYNEIREQLKWVLNMSDPLDLGLCVNTCDPGSVPDGRELAGVLINRLEQNHPNPFNPRTTISFSLAQAGPTQLVIYDVSGRKVRTLVDGHKEAGPHSMVWDGLDDSGRPVASGVFWSQLAVDGFSSNKKMVVLK